MPKASKTVPSAQYTIDKVLQEDSDQEGARSDQEVFFNPQPSTSKKVQICQVLTCICPILKAFHGLDCK